MRQFRGEGTYASVAEALRLRSGHALRAAQAPVMQNRHAWTGRSPAAPPGTFPVRGSPQPAPPETDALREEKLFS